MPDVLGRKKDRKYSGRETDQTNCVEENKGSQRNNGEVDGHLRSIAD